MEAERGPLREVGYRRYLAGMAVSLTGNAVAPVALAFSVLEIAPHVADLGWVLAARSIPLVVFLVIGGAIADRWPRRGVLLVTHLGAAVTQGTVAWLLLTGQYQLGTILVLEVANGALTAFMSPAMRGIVPQLVSKAQLRKANSLVGAARNAAVIVGPTVAGVLVAVANGGWAIAFDALTFVVAGALFSTLRLPPVDAPKGPGILADIREGWREFWRITWLWPIVTSVGVANYLRTGIWSVLGPIIALTSIGSAAWGTVLSARAVGLLVMSLVMYRLAVGRLLPIGQVGLAVGALPLVTLGLDATVAILVATAFMAGLGSGIFATAWETTVHEHIPGSMLSRMTSFDELISYVAVPLGMATAAPIGAALGNERTAVIGGLLFLVFALLPLLSHAVRRVRHPAADSEPDKDKVLT